MNEDTLMHRLNAGTREEFIRILGAVYEHSPWIAASAWDRRPFADRTALHAALQAVMLQAPDAAQLALIRAHPDLAGKLARAGTLEAHSTAEQQGLGLNRLSDAEYEQFDRLNTAYRARFAFPFIIAVRAQTRDSVLALFAARLENTPERERLTALEEIGKIAWYRIQDLVPQS